MYRFVRTARGLTLIELVGAMAVSTLLLSGAWQLLHSGMQSYHRGLQEVRMTQDAQTLLRIVAQDVRRAFAARASHGIAGAAPPAATAAPEEGLHDRLTLLALPSLSAARAAATRPGQPQHIRYLLNTVADRQRLTLQRVVTSGSAAQGEQSMLLHEHVHALEVRYFDGQAWQDAWQQAELPRAVEITLVARSDGAQPRLSRFTTLVTAD